MTAPVRIELRVNPLLNRSTGLIPCHRLGINTFGQGTGTIRDHHPDYPGTLQTDVNLRIEGVCIPYSAALPKSISPRSFTTHNLTAGPRGHHCHNNNLK